MAIAIDAGGAGGNSSANTTGYSFNHTMSAAAGGRIYVAVYHSGGAGGVTGVTAGGVAMALIDEATQTDATVSLWVLSGPPTGVISIAVTCASNRCLAASLSLTGAKTVTDATAKSTGSGANPAQAVTSVADNTWMVVGVGGFDAQNISADFTYEVDHATGNERVVGIAADGPKTPAGSRTCTWTMTATPWAMVGATVAPAGSSNSRKMPRGVTRGVERGVA